MTGDRAVALSHGGPLVRVRFGIGEGHRESHEAMGLPWPSPLPMVALLDTGADLCVVKHGVLRSLGVEAMTRRVVTVLGRPRQARFSYLGEFTFENGVPVPGAVIEDLTDDARIDCILGREVLRYGRMVYDGRQGTVELAMMGKPVAMIGNPEDLT